MRWSAAALLLGTACAAGPWVEADRAGTVVFARVRVIPMDRPGATGEVNVVVREGRIASITSTSGGLPPGTEGARIVEGAGRYLVPGLADMHVHLADADELVLLLAHGVTTIRNMSEYPGWSRAFMGLPDVLALRDRIERGEILGPAIVTAGEVLEGRPRISPFMREIVTPKEGREAVVAQARRGVDLIKVYDRLDRETFVEIAKTARTLGLPIAGHVPRAVGHDLAIASGLRSIEHLTAYIDNDRAGFVIPEDALDAYAQRAAASGVWNCPTLVVWDSLVPRGDFARLAARPEMQHVPKLMRFVWRQTLEKAYENDYTGPDYAAHMTRISLRMTRALVANGARILAGTDTNFVGVFPGTSLHRELELLVAAGMTPAEALASATLRPAQYLGRAGSGRIIAGARADLVLLSASPLEDIRNTRRIEGVMVRGTWLSRGALDEAVRRLD